jgi:thiosulfate dehydrogenase (quinone) large subunit
MTTKRRAPGAADVNGRMADRIDAVTTRFGPATVRWILGLMWLSNVNWKVPTEFGALRNFVQEGIDHPVVPGSAWVLEEVVLSQISAFGWITLFVEVGVAAALLAGRFVRVAAVVSAVQAVGIGLSVANAPNEWYWAYLLMIGLSLAVLTLAPGDRPHSPRLMGAVVAVYGVVVAVTNADAGFAGNDNASRSLFTGRNDIPDEFGVSMFPGSVLLGLVFVAVGVGSWLLASAAPQVRRALGWGAVVASALLLLTYRAAPDDLVIGLGSRAVHCGILAALGLSLLPGRTPEPAPT